MFRETLDKQGTFRTPKGIEKQLDFLLVYRKHAHCCRDAEANDMIHMAYGTICYFCTKEGSFIVKEKIETAEHKEPR